MNFTEKTPVKELDGGQLANASEISGWQRTKRAAGLASRVLVAGTCMYSGSLLGVAAGNTLHPVEISAGPFTADITMEPRVIPEGGSTIETQLGSAMYPTTHKGAAISAVPKLGNSVNSESLLSGGSDLETVVETTQAELKPQIRSIAGRTARNTTLYSLAGNGAGLLAYAGATSLFEKRRRTEKITMPKKFIAIGALAVCTISALPYSAQPYVTRNPHYAENVEFSGLIAEAQKYADNYQVLSRQLRNPAAQFYALNRAVEGLNSPDLFKEEPRLCLYFASDAHGGGYRIINELYQYDAEANCIKLTVFKGDAVDWGMEFEQGRDAVQLLPSLQRPVLVVRGNHDSQNLMNYIRTLPGVNDIGGHEFEVSGIRVLGITDSTFTPDSSEDRETNDEAAYQAGVRAGESYEATDIPAVIVAHRPNMLEGFLSELTEEEKDSIILVAAGHTHQLRVENNFAGSGIPYLNAGSATGSGLRMFDPETGTETLLSAATAYIAADEAGNLRLQKVGQLVQNFEGTNSTYSLWTPASTDAEEQSGTTNSIPE